MSSTERYLAHVDMDAFFARVEKKDNPDIADEPVIVGGLGKRGVVSTACYRARKHGVHSAMPMETARQKCPEAVFLSPRTGRYREISEDIRETFSSITPSYKPLSLDEAYLDVTGVLHHYESLTDLAVEIRKRIYDRTQLTASVGVGPNKMIAKLASDYCKPDGYHVVREDETRSFVGSLSVAEIPGIGPSTLRRMKEEGIERVVDIQELPPESLTEKFGQRGLVYHRKAEGEGTSELDLDEDQKSLSNEETYAEDVTDEEHLLDRLHFLTTKVTRRLRSKELEARTVFLKERRGDFTTITRQRTLAEPVRTKKTIWEWIQRIFRDDVQVDRRGIRLQGVGLKNLRSRNVQERLFQDESDKKRDELDHIVDEINSELGDGSIVRGRNLENE